MDTDSKFSRYLCSGHFTGDSKWRNGLITVMSWIAAFLYAATVYFLVIKRNEAASNQGWAKVLLILWSVLPPAWFWIEYHLLWRTAGDTARSSLDEFKHGQELSRNIWLAFVAVLAGIYFKQ